MTATLIHISVTGGHYLDFMDIDLPMPLKVAENSRYSASYWNKETDSSYRITYAIDGYFSTGAGKQYLHDVAGRIAYALNGTYEIEESTKVTGIIHRLSRFNHLERVPTYFAELESNAFNGSRNEIFDALRMKAYQMHKAGTLNLEALITYGNRISNSSEHIKYLAPNIFHWVESNYTGRQSSMSRTEAGINASNTRSNRIRQRIFSALKNPLLPNLTESSISSASKLLSVSRQTFKKYLKQYQLIQTAQRLLQRLSTPYVRLDVTGIQKVLKTVKEWLSVDNIQSVLAIESKEYTIEKVFKPEKYYRN